MFSSKSKYFYNPDTLKYEKVVSSFKDLFFSFIKFLLGALFFVVIGVITSYFYLDNPKEQQLKEEIETLTLQYEFLQKRIKSMDGVLSELEERDKDIYRVIFESEPIASAEWQANFNNLSRYKKFENSNFYPLIIETSRKTDELAKKMYVQSKSYESLSKIVQNKSKLMESMPAIQPISNKHLTRMASGYGYRIHPIYKTRKMHTGMDFTAPSGTPIYATGNGVVSAAGNDSGFGQRVIINHGFGYQTLYAHMSKISTSVGKKVVRGQVIGYVGNTGLSTGAHLHYEVHKNGKPVNPINYYFNDLTPAEYAKMVEMSSKINQAFD